jgi:acetylornithine deacetylase
MSLLDETCAILGDLIAFPTVSADSNLDLIAYAAERLGACGATIAINRDGSGTKANLFATIGPEGDGGIVLSGHTDVVPVIVEEWTSDPFLLREQDGRLYGRGACDMKGFIAAALAMAPRLAAAKLARPVHFAFTYDEEVGCFGGQQLLADLKRSGVHPAVAIVGEPTMMRIIEGHKGCYEYTTEFHGLDGHGSDPDAGVNAIEYAVRYVARMLELRERLKRRPVEGSRFQPPWTTLQVGRMEGGTARNVIARHCAVEWEMRPVHLHDADEVKAELKAYCDEVLLPSMRAVSPEADIVTHVIGEVAGLEPVPANEAREIVSALTGQRDCDVVPFGTEAGLFQAYGMSVVVCGPGSIEQAHKPDEFVTKDQLQACLDMLSGLERKLKA